MRAIKTTENIGIFCKSDDKKEMMHFLGCDEKYNKEKCSDFEFFAEWERILPLCAGSESAYLYEKQLSLLGICAKKNDGFRASSKELWQMGNEKLTEETKCYFTRKYQKMMEKQGFDIFEYITNIANETATASAKDISSWDWLSKRLFSALGVCSHLFLDLSKMRYVRPDRYHASLAWQKILCGEKIKEEERFVLGFQLLIEALLFFKQKKISTTVRLFSHDASLCEQTILYLKGNCLMEGEIRCSLFLDTPPSVYLSLCRQSEGQIRVLPELVLRPSDLGAPLAPALREIATVYPIGGLRFGRILSDSPSLSLVATEEAYEKIDAFLLIEGICDEKRQEILNNIFNS